MLGSSSPGAGDRWGQAGMCSLRQLLPSCTSPSVQPRLGEKGYLGLYALKKTKGVTVGTRGSSKRWEQRWLPERAVGSRSSYTTPQGGFLPACLPV